MRFRTLSRVLAGLLLAAHPVHAATDEQSGWLAWFNTAALGPEISLISDVQLRSRDDWAGPRNLLVRPGLAWTVARGHTLSAGYAYIGSYPANAPDTTEHRSWQQYVYSRALPFGSLAQRFRLEQRFIGRAGGPDVYSDRLRWFSRSVIPLDGVMPLKHGAFMALQNEVFVNLSSRDRLNGRVFDQNRAYIAFGWRSGPLADMEVGYLNQWINGRAGDTVNHIVQVALYTNF